MSDTKHISDEMYHWCKSHKSVVMNSGLFGHAITDIVYQKESKQWFAYNGEYASQILYCPFCGINLTTIKPIMKR